MLKLLALGDCNTLGHEELMYNSFPERIARELGMVCENKGYTMSTTREGMRFFKDFYTPDCSLLVIQFGLVDSWKTVAYAPYVLYYPDNVLRKIGRKFSKKFKKIAKKTGLKNILGEANLVSLSEYEENIISILEVVQDTNVFLIETVPNLDRSRNADIREFNKVLVELAAGFKNVHVLKVYDLFDKSLPVYLGSDGTHINDMGYDLITQEFLKMYENI